MIALDNKIKKLERSFNPPDKTALRIIVNSTPKELRDSSYKSLEAKYKDSSLPDIDGWELRRKASSILMTSNLSRDKYRGYSEKFDVIDFIGIYHGRETWEEVRRFQKGKRGGRII